MTKMLDTTAHVVSAVEIATLPTRTSCQQEERTDGGKAQGRSNFVLKNCAARSYLIRCVESMFFTFPKPH